MATPYILVLYYSQAGSVAAMAEHMVRGIEKVSGMEARLRCVPSVSTDTQARRPTVLQRRRPQELSRIAFRQPSAFWQHGRCVKIFFGRHQ